MFDMPLRIKNYLILLSRKITTLISFKIESKYEDWVKIFDSKESYLRNSKFDIKSLFRGYRKDYPKNVICINQAPDGNIQKFVLANSEWIKSHKVDFSTMGSIIMDMNRFRIANIIMIFSSLSYFSVTFFRNYNSPENIEKRCIFKFEKDFKIPLETSSEEWVEILDSADNNYLKCMGLPQY